MNPRSGKASFIVTRQPWSLFALMVCALLWSAESAADEGGASFWLPGQFGSLAAVPVAPGWSLGAVYYHSSIGADGSKDFEIGGRIVAGLAARADLVFLVPTHTFATPVLGGQAALSLTGIVGHVHASVSGTLTGPRGGMISGSTADSVTGGGDLFPQGTLKWNDGNSNYLVYAMAGIPTGAYRSDRLANIGLNHWSIDAGGGYTYLDQKSGREFSAVIGATYNFENPDTNYQSGIDGHLDWGASQFLSDEVHVGLVGYFYQQLTGDTGSGAKLGAFKSRVSAIGPQIGSTIPLPSAFGGAKGYLNLKGYWEFDAQNRPDGWNVWLTLSVPLGGGK